MIEFTAIDVQTRKPITLIYRGKRFKDIFPNDSCITADGKEYTVVSVELSYLTGIPKNIKVMRRLECLKRDSIIFFKGLMTAHELDERLAEMGLKITLA